MKELIKTFDGKNIRIIMLNGEPFFNAQDSCRCLGLSNTSEALRKLDEDDIILNDTKDSLGRKVKVKFISEAGLYDLLMDSRKREVKPFKRWVTHEILPQIRKNGHYSIPENIKRISTKNRNALTDEWSRHGIEKKHYFIQLTLQEYKALGIKKGKKKKDFDRGELALLSALESMEMLKLFNDGDKDGYYECKDSLIETSSQIKQITGKKNVLEPVFKDIKKIEE